MYIGPSIIRSLLIFCSIAASSPLPATHLVGHIEVVLVVCKVALCSTEVVVERLRLLLLRLLDELLVVPAFFFLPLAKAKTAFTLK